MTLKFAVDISQRKLVLSPYRPEPFVLPVLVQGDTISLEIQLCEPNYGAGFGRYSLVNIANLTLRAAIIGHRPIGNASDTPEVLQTSWIKDTATNTFKGVLSMGAGVTTLLGAASSVDAYFEIETKDGDTGYYDTVYPWALCTIRAEAIEDGVLVSPPVSGGSALTVQEGNQIYVKRRGLPGEMFSLVSANGLWERIIGVDDNGTKLDEVIEYVP